MCCKRTLSLLGSLIHHYFLTVNTFAGIVGKAIFGDKVHVPPQQLFQFSPHSKETQTDRLCLVKVNKQINITILCFLATGKGSE